MPKDQFDVEDDDDDSSNQDETVFHFEPEGVHAYIQVRTQIKKYNFFFLQMITFIDNLFYGLRC